MRTSTLRRADAPPAPDRVSATVRMPSIPPMSYDLEDIFPAARNSDALGARSTQFLTRGRGGPFWAGLASGMLALLIAAGFAFAALTAEEADPPRDRHTVAHWASSLEIAMPADAVDKAAPPRKAVHHHRHVEASDPVTIDMLPNAE